MTAKTKTLHDLFLHQLRDVHYAERHGAKMLGKLGKAASDEALASTLDGFSRQLHDRAEHLDGVFEALGKKAHGVPCEAMQGLVEEAKDLLDEFEDSEALDAGLLAAAQAIAHYGVARYGALMAWGGQLDLADDVRSPIAAALDERKRMVTALDGSASKAEPPPADPDRLTLQTAALAGLA